MGRCGEHGSMPRTKNSLNLTSNLNNNPKKYGECQIYSSICKRWKNFTTLYTVSSKGKRRPTIHQWILSLSSSPEDSERALTSTPHPDHTHTWTSDDNCIQSTKRARRKPDLINAFSNAIIKDKLPPKFMVNSSHPILSENHLHRSKACLTTADGHRLHHHLVADCYPSSSNANYHHHRCLIVATATNRRHRHRHLPPPPLPSTKRVGEIEKAVQVFKGMVFKDVFTWSSMVDGYWKNGMVLEARKAFEAMPVKNVVSWTAMIQDPYQGLDLPRMTYLAASKEVNSLPSLLQCIHGKESNLLVVKFLKERIHFLTDMATNSARNDAWCGAPTTLYA
ncbi:hypothetical protein M5K25_011049 [Dendrobium thyrsiflorum]|uniref:Pentatricopeptide repeat-containing protein n=1 Tax=Dendrobium thyrsiflorum TaxID=117978 RepID=A0ABD0V208_DENTH